MLTQPQKAHQYQSCRWRFIIMYIPILLLALASNSLWAASPDLSQAIQLNVDKYELPNGLTVLLQEDHSAPLVSVHQWFRVGSKDELPGRTGLAHFFEHMMFKGTKKYSKDVFGQTLTSKGGEFNAFTNNDYTGYYINIPSENLKLVLSIESDRMRNLLLDSKDVQSEREVVKEERRMRTDNQPEGVIRETLSDMMFKNLPYKWPIIGSMEDLNQATMDDLHAFYKRFYSPNNAVLVIAGDFDPKKVKEWIADFYGSYPREKIDRVQYSQEFDQQKAQEKVIERNVQSPIVFVSYLTPPAASPETYALDLLTTILGQGDSSRLHRQLVYKDQIATSAGAGCQDQMLASRCFVSVYLKPGGNPRSALKLIEKEIQNVISKKVSAKELEKAKNNATMDFVNQLSKIGGRAEALAYNEAVFGDYKRLFTDIPAFQAVTAEQIQDVAKKYFRLDHRNVIIMMPEKKAAKVSSKAAAKKQEL
jgi:zinc protease